MGFQFTFTTFEAFEASRTSNTVPVLPTNTHKINYTHDIYLKGLTCDIQGDWGRSCGIFAQVAGESGTIVFIDDGCNTHAAATLLIFCRQTDDSAIPQPNQLFLSWSLMAAVRLTNQRHSLLQFCLYNTLTVDFWDRLDRDTLGKERGRKWKL